MIMSWNLARDLQNVNKPGRHFAPPLGGFVPDGANTDPFALPSALPSPSLYTVEDVYDHDRARRHTLDVTLKIGAHPTSAGGFPREDSYLELPPPAIRLHAIARGTLWFRPPPGPLLKPRLVLDTLSFGKEIAPSVPWFHRWIEAGCIPRYVYYDNVDVTQLRDYLRSLPFSGKYGLSFGVSSLAPILTEAARDAFVEGFLLGTVDPSTGRPTHVMSVEPSAVIGCAGPHPATPGSFELRLSARYADHTEATPQPISPRELMNLVFGSSSLMSLQHPLLRALDTPVTPGPIGTHSKVLRPPLRTWARLMWEAEREAEHDEAISPASAQRWSQAGSLDLDALFDTVFERPQTSGGTAQPVGHGQLPNIPKCNVFTSEMSVRAGFRVMITAQGGTPWHYANSNAHTYAAMLALRNHATADVTAHPMRGLQADDASRLWGRVWTRFILAGTEPAVLNQKMIIEGRAFIVAGARPGEPGVGHIVLVREITEAADNPVLTTNRRGPATDSPRWDAALTEYPDVIQRLGLRSAQANSPTGARSALDVSFQLGIPPGGGDSTNPSSHFGFFRIQLIEAAPGRDPDLLQGLYDLHVRYS